MTLKQLLFAASASAFDDSAAAFVKRSVTGNSSNMEKVAAAKMYHNEEAPNQ
jgi:hypothetical protein